jgi:chromate transport protein ChrA
MTKQEFISKEQAYKKISGKGAVIAVLCVIAVSIILMGGLAATLYARSLVKNEWLAIFVTAGVAGIVFFIPLSISIRLLTRWIYVRLMRLGLVCTGCGLQFLGQSARVVLKTGKCGRCCKKILDDIPDA